MDSPNFSWFKLLLNSRFQRTKVNNFFRHWRLKIAESLLNFFSSLSRGFHDVLTRMSFVTRWLRRKKERKMFSIVPLIVVAWNCINFVVVSCSLWRSEIKKRWANLFTKKTSKETNEEVFHQGHTCHRTLKSHHQQTKQQKSPRSQKCLSWQFSDAQSFSSFALKRVSKNLRTVSKWKTAFFRCVLESIDRSLSQKDILELLLRNAVDRFDDCFSCCKIIL